MQSRRTKESGTLRKRRDSRLTRTVPLWDCRFASCLVLEQFSGQRYLPHRFGTASNTSGASSVRGCGWRVGTLNVHDKGRRIDTLLLPKLTGRATTVYLRQGRPQTTRRELFVRHRPPINAPAGPDIIRNAVCYAAERRGLEQRIPGTHIFRRTVACRMKGRLSRRLQICFAIAVSIPQLFMPKSIWPPSHASLCRGRGGAREPLEYALLVSMPILLIAAGRALRCGVMASDSSALRALPIG
jgi:hypothetical protein